MVKQYTPEELTQLHQVLYEILEEIVRICDKHNIPYFVIGGTAIGALYDKAILPWDDDIDIGMKREDYNKFLQIASQELREPYFLSWIHTDPHSPYYFAKVKKNNTLFVEEMFKDVPMHQGIFVDIFPFDRIPNNKLLSLKSATKLFSVLLASKRPLITELADKLRLKYPLLPTISPCPTMRLEAIRSIIPISCRRYPKSV